MIGTGALISVLPIMESIMTSTTSTSSTTSTAIDAVTVAAASGSPIITNISAAMYMLAYARISVGALAWIHPTLASRVFGLGNMGDDNRSALMSRLFGARDAFIGAALAYTISTTSLATASGTYAALPIVLGLGISVDIADIIATGLAYRQGVRSPLALFMCGGGAAVFATLGFYGIHLYK
jgi:hypothetical protein